MEIAVISGKGGTGKSSISAALACIPGKVVLADCDVDAANMHILFQPDVAVEEEFIGSQLAVIDHDKCSNCGLCIDYCRFDAISFKNSMVEISETSCDGCKLCSRICPMNAISIIDNNKSRLYTGSFRHGKMVYGRLAPGEENSGKLVNMVRDRAKEIAKENNIDTIIIDGPPGIGCPVISTITGADQVLIVTEPSLSGLHDLERTIDLTTKFELKTRVLINKSDLNSEISDRIEEYCKSKDIEVAAKLPFNKEVVNAMVNCKSIIEHSPNSETSKPKKQILHP